MGLIQYTQDFDEMLPRADYDPVTTTAFDNSTLSSGGQRYKWMDAIFPYIKNEQLFTCPSRPRLISDYRYGNSNNYGSYAVNCMYNNFSSYRGFKPPSGSTSGSWDTKMSEIGIPAETIWAVDRGGKTNPSNGNHDNTYAYMVQCGPAFNPQCAVLTNTGIRLATEVSSGNRAFFPGNNYSGTFAERHLGTATILWCDGHVKALPMDTLLTRGNLTAGTVTSLKYFTISED